MLYVCLHIHTRQLPHRIGNGLEALEQDDVLRITRATLVDLSKTSIALVLERLVAILEDFARPYKNATTHPAYVLHSESYILSLTADCCAAHLKVLCPNGQDDSYDNEGRKHEALPTIPEPLDTPVVKRYFGVLQGLLDPIPDDYILHAQRLLDHEYSQNALPENLDYKKSLRTELSSYAAVVVEFITASSWPAAFEYLRNVIYQIRTATSSGSSEPSTSSQDVERSSLVFLSLLSSFSVDGPKLGLIIQELCSSYLHFKRPYQNTVAAVLPLLITRWIGRFPMQFSKLHLTNRRLDGGAETLFDMTQTVVETGRRRGQLFPLQTTLLLLLPEIFEVASHLREAKSSSVAKKVTYLDGLRKALKNGNEQAGYCLVAIIRSARYFDIHGDSALLSYAMDVQDEVVDSVFSPVSSGNGGPSHFDSDMMTSALISLAHLSLADSVETLVERSISPTAPKDLKLAIVQACCYFARHQEASKYQKMFDKTFPFMREQLEVSD